jgi:hypothetical protein
MEPEQKDNAGAPNGDQPGEQQETAKRLLSAATESAEGFLPGWAKPLYKWGKKEWAGIKAGKLLFGIIALAILAVFVWPLNKAWRKQAEIESTNSILSNSNSFLRGEIQQNEKLLRTAETTIQNLKGDATRLEIAKAAAENRAAIFEAIPLQIPSIITNLSNLIATQPTNQQQLLVLLDAVQSLTNALSEISARPTFDFYINYTRITNNAVISLKQSRLIKLRVHNTSSVTAQEVTVDFSAPLGLDKTNLLFHGWDLMPAGVLMSSDAYTSIPTGNHWKWVADKIVPGMQGHDVESSEISTNFPFPVIQVQFNISSINSKLKRYFVSFTF